MSRASPPLERGTSPLMSNNPFRNRIVSPTADVHVRPVSTNPFLDATEINAYADPATDGASVHRTADALHAVRLGDRSQPARHETTVTNGAMPGREVNGVPPPRGPPPGHRPSLSEREHRRESSHMRKKQGELDIFADPSDSTRPRESHRRRNSEGSVRERPNRLLDPEGEEKKRRERKQRESRRPAKPGKPSRKLDVIDKLDVTSIYGMGLFHHDGPFDACNPHRNRKGSRQAPMQAFPADSTNMSIGGAGPVNNKLDYDRFHGRGQEAHIDYNEAAIAEEETELARRPGGERGAGFNPNARDAVHGDETIGLGTSTFLEGAPASRRAIERRESEIDVTPYEGGPPLSRKKSLVQKIRGVRPRDGSRVLSPEGPPTPSSPLGTGQSDHAGNPFFKDYDRDTERKGGPVAYAEEPSRPGRARAPSSPRRGILERRMTSESTGAEGEGKPSGFLGRMKSLKGRRPQR